MNTEDIIALETRLAYQEKLIQELSDVVFGQQKEIDHLHYLYKLLDRRLQSLTDNSGQGVINDPPPHY
ncbi:SlyX protein [Desulfobotulus alkaliphilus]|uniref:SlyX protein n=1 Tax=Desulfobotulus alkaliphilus TaxID=622671 RepID=A0A562RRG9_9BACT|nr:SlyX family protein [Desulfobotulus alkaliphilus]TWI71104.1 SlyX protein [Desulfobotulus alkaliphilus]